MIIFWFIPQQTEKIHAQIIRLNQLSIEMKVENYLIKKELNNKVKLRFKTRFADAIKALQQLQKALKSFENVYFQKNMYNLIKENGNDKSTN